MTFTLNMDQSILASKFEHDHLHRDKEHGAIGGGIVYTFANTGLGQVAKVSCDLCGETLDLTEYDNW